MLASTTAILTRPTIFPELLAQFGALLLRQSALPGFTLLPAGPLRRHGLTNFAAPMLRLRRRASARRWATGRHLRHGTSSEQERRKGPHWIFHHAFSNVASFARVHKLMGYADPGVAQYL